MRNLIMVRLHYAFLYGGLAALFPVVFVAVILSPALISVFIFGYRDTHDVSALLWAFSAVALALFLFGFLQGLVFGRNAGRHALE